MNRQNSRKSMCNDAASDRFEKQSIGSFGMKKFKEENPDVVEKPAKKGSFSKFRPPGGNKSF